jgi:hypothetical protein
MEFDDVASGYGITVSLPKNHGCDCLEDLRGAACDWGGALQVLGDEVHGLDLLRMRTDP